MFEEISVQIKRIDWSRSRVDLALDPSTRIRNDKGANSTVAGKRRVEIDPSESSAKRYRESGDREEAVKFSC